MAAPLQITRPREEYHQLLESQRQEKQAKVKQRMLVILARWDGIPVQEIARQQRLHRDTIHKWVRRFNTEGITGLIDKPRCGGPRKWDWSQLQADLQQSPTEFGYPIQGWTYKLVKYHLAHRYHVDYHLGSMAYILRQLGFRAIVPRPQNVQTDPETQETWKKRQE